MSAVASDRSLHTGACLCGGVAYEVSGPLRNVVLCHCGRCRRTHGHVAAYTECGAGQLRLVEEAWLRWYDADDRERGFCGRCGASVFWRETADSQTISIAAGTIDPPTGLRTTEQIYVASAGDYYGLGTEGKLHAEGRRSAPPGP
jgi:hypothetical protein